MESISDKQILEQFNRPGGADQAFIWLIGKYQERLYWVIRRIVLRHEDADDVLQETFVRIWKGLGNFRKDSGLYTWMYRIAVNESISFKRKNQKRNMGAAGVEDNYLLNNLRSDPHYDGDQLYDRFLLAIETLPSKQKQVFRLKYFDDIKYEEMSELLDTSVGALKASYHHAVKKIQGIIKSED